MPDFFKKQKTVESIAVGFIEPNPFQPRRKFDEKELADLAESIAENGLIQPIAVRKTKGGYELIAGERRLRACKLLGRQKIEAIVYDIGDEDSAVWALIENLHRRDLSPFDEAEAMAKLVLLWKVSKEDAAKRLGIAPSSLSNKLRLLKLEKPVRETAEKAGFTERHARELLRLKTEEERIFAAKHIAEKQLNVPETEKYIKGLLKKKAKRSAPKYLIKDMRIFINTFEHAVEVMNCAGLCAVSTVTENEESIVYSVSVPKSKAYKTAALPAEESAAPVCSACTPSVI